MRRVSAFIRRLGLVMLGALVFLGSFDAVAFLGTHRLAISMFGGGLVVLLPLLIWLPRWQASHVQDEKNRLTVENDARQTLAQIIGGAVLIVGLFFTTKTLNLTREGQITDRFTKAIAQLGEEAPGKMTLRIGGIYALERIAKDSDKDHWPIMEILTSYVRKETPVLWKNVQLQETPAPAKDICPRKYDREESRVPRKDVQLQETSAPAKDNRPRKYHSDIAAVLTVLKRRTWKYEKGKEEQRLNLQSIDLSDIVLQEAQLDRADLQGAYLKNTRLWKARLQGADLYGADLRDAILVGADLKEAKLWRADLRGADFSEAELNGADLWEARLEGAKLTDKQRATLKNRGQAQINTPPITAESTEGHIAPPQDGKEVGEQISVHGSIHNLPHDGRLWLAVKKGDFIWPKYPEVPVTDSSWTVTVNEGGTPPGHPFELVLYLVRDKGHKEIIEWLRLGYKTGAFPGLRTIAESIKLDSIQLCMR